MPWVAIKAVTLGTTSKMYSLCTPDIQTAVKEKEQKYFNKGQNDLFAAVICFKYLLPVAEFHRVCDALNYEINVLCGKTKQFQKNKILSCMGFPDNWPDIKTVGSAELHESTDK